MHRPRKLLRQDAVDKSLPLDPGQPREARRNDTHRKVTFATGPVACMAGMKRAVVDDLERCRGQGIGQLATHRLMHGQRCSPDCAPSLPGMAATAPTQAPTAATRASAPQDARRRLKGPRPPTILRAMPLARGFRRHDAYDEPPPLPRMCDHPGCAGHGEHRAPKSRRALNDYWWFCLDHVREYNKAWNYYVGMTPEEIEQEARADLVWQRPTWKMGSWKQDTRLRERVWHNFGAGDGDDPLHARAWGGARADQAARKASTEAERASETLGLSEPFDIKQLKTAYKALVKRHHPDANGGSREAEEKLKIINQAYAVLKARLSA